jgi:ribosomal protein L11 methyltransferase
MTIDQENQRSTPPCAPYRDLHIYYVQGSAEDPSLSAVEGFIGNWQEDGFSFLFFSQPAEGAVETLLKKRSDLFLLDRYQMRYEDWQGRETGSLEAGCFLITPAWGTPAASRPGLKPIFLDPGVVFGNGAHATTRACLEALEIVYDRQPVESVVDLGTGSGILAIAAVHLGCRRCLAVDFNYLAAKTALKNVRLNHMESRIMVINGRAEDFLSVESDLVMANIHYDVMNSLVVSEWFFTRKWYILSGLLRSEAARIRDRLEGLGIELVKAWDHDGIWHTFLAMMR